MHIFPVKWPAFKSTSGSEPPVAASPHSQLSHALGALSGDTSTRIAMERALTPNAGCVGEDVDSALRGTARAGLEFREALASPVVMECVQDLLERDETLHVHLPAEFANWEEAREAIGQNLTGLSKLATITLDGQGPHDLTPLRAAIEGGVEVLYSGVALNAPESAIGAPQDNASAAGTSFLGYVKTLVLGYLALSGYAPHTATAGPTHIRSEPYRDVMKSVSDAKYVVLGERHYDGYNQLVNALTVESAGPVAFYREGAALHPIAALRENEKACKASVIERDHRAIERNRRECARYFAQFVTPSDTKYRARLERSLSSPNVTGLNFMLFNEASADDVGRAMDEAVRVILSMGHMHATGHVHQDSMVWDDPTGLITNLPSGLEATARNEQVAFRLFDRLQKHKPAVLVQASTVWEGIEDGVRRVGAALAPRSNFHKHFANLKYCVIEVRIAPRFNVTVVAPASYKSALLKVAGRYPDEITIISPATGALQPKRGEL